VTDPLTPKVDADLVSVWPQLKWKDPKSAALSALEASRNCSCATGAAATAWSTRGAAQPSHHAFRVDAGNPKDAQDNPRGLATSEALKALLKNGALATRHYGEDFAVVWQALEAGKIVMCCVDYGAINAYDGGKYSGQKTFRGGHSLIVQGLIRNDPKLAGRNSTTDNDPLFDGRKKSWGTAPDGPQQVPVQMIRQAMGAFRVGGTTYATGTPIGVNKGVFLVIDQPETPEETIARLTAELAACRAETPEQTIARLTAELEACQAPAPEVIP